MFWRQWLKRQNLTVVDVRASISKDDWRVGSRLSRGCCCGGGEWGDGGDGGRGVGGDTAASQTNPKENGVAFGEAVFIFLQTS